MKNEQYFKVEEKSGEETTTVVNEEETHAVSSREPLDEANEEIDVRDCDTFADFLPHIKTWQEYVEEAVTDTEWMALLAIHSGICPMFVRHQNFIIDAFRHHIALQGMGLSIQSHRDIRSHFANFLRPGTPTHKRTLRQLLDEEERLRKNPERRFETIYSTTGKRSYHGHPIPDDAPPRPNNTAVWSENKKKWF